MADIGKRDRKEANGDVRSKKPRRPVTKYFPRWPRSRTPSVEQLAMPVFVLPLDAGSSIIHVPNFLTVEQRARAWDADVERVQGPASFGHLKPRREVCYSTDGKPYVYSGRAQPTIQYPQHVLDMVPGIVAIMREHAPDLPCTRLDHGVDIAYGADLPGGGSIGQHSDDENPNWGAVAIVSMGQRRWMRFRRKCDEGPNCDLCHLPLDDRSLVIMSGANFQKWYTHEVPKLPSLVVPEERRSLNIRFICETESGGGDVAVPVAEAPEEEEATAAMLSGKDDNSSSSDV